MSSNRYYLVSGSREVLVQELWDQYVKVHKAREAFRKQHHGIGVAVWRHNKWGLVFSEPPQDSSWKRDRKSGYWLPRAGTKLAREMALPRYIAVSGAEICKAVGVEEFNHKTGNFSTPGVEITPDNQLVVVLSDWQKPSKGLVRISDIEYETLMSKPKRKPKKKKVKNV